MEAARRTCSAVSGMNFFRKGWGLGKTVSTVHDLSEYKQDRAHEQAYANEVVETFDREVLSPGEPFASILWFFDAHTPWTSEPRFSGENPKRDAYDTELAFIDRHLGSLFSKLKEASVYDETLIIFTSDHGDIFMDHHRLEGTRVADLAVQYEVPKLSTILRGDGYLGHLAKPLYEELLHVPLYLKLPHQQHGGLTVDHQVELVDLLPTVLDIADIDVPERERDWQGESLVSVIDGKTRGREYTFADVVAREVNGRHLAIRGPEYKLIRNERPNLSFEHLKDDPLTCLIRRYLTPEQQLLHRSDESTDRSEEEPGRARRMADRLNDWVAGMETTADSQPASSEITNEQEEHLEQLGYL